MPDKPITAAGYSSNQTELVRATCLYVATKLGDLVDEVVVVGGLVPSLLIDQHQLPAGADTHVGTMDLDVGLTLAIFDHQRYQTLTDRLRRAGLVQDESESGRATRQRWRIEGIGRVTVDFLIPPTSADDQGGKLKNIEPDFAAIVAPGLMVAFRDRQRITLTGCTIMGEEATRDVWVCGPGAFIVLKALAFDGRGENKDAYDLFYVLRNYGSGVDDVLRFLRPLLDEPDASRAIGILRRDFLVHDGPGPRRVAEFVTGGPDDAIQADVVGFVRSLLEGCR
jgi:hypothetical protein